MKTCGKLIFLIVLAFLCGCDVSSDSNGIMVFSYGFDFSKGQQNWHVDFTDFPADVDTSSYELKFAYTDRPANLGANKLSMMVSGNNQSGDLFMYMKRKITDLSPNADYTLVFEVELASNAQEGTAGAADSPGESVYLKAGASGTEPKRVIEDNQYALNIDKGNQNISGETAIVLGNIAVPANTQGYALITRNSALNEPFVVRSNSKGEIWLIIGTDSGFRGTTTVYYTRVNVVLSTASN